MLVFKLITVLHKVLETDFQYWYLTLKQGEKHPVFPSLIYLVYRGTSSNQDKENTFRILFRTILLLGRGHPGLNFKDLRKTYITRMTEELGASAKIFTGHTNDEVKRLYDCGFGHCSKY